MKAVCLLGPTGVGKTAAALALARAFPAAVVNFDSRQTYRDFPLITAQPAPEERAACPHLLYGFLDTGEKTGAGPFAGLARAALAEVAADGRVPVLVGGTGLYLDAILSGLAPIPEIPQEVRSEVRRRLETEGSPALYAELERRDPAYAAKSHPNNRQRNARALEVLLATGKPFSWWHGRRPEGPGVAALKLGLTLPMEELAPRLARRIDLMLAAGALDEARRAFERCPDPAAPGWTGIGCAELLAVLRGDLSLEEAKALWLKNTRAYAKRQMTWFRRDKAVAWLAPGREDEAVERALDFLA